MCLGHWKALPREHQRQIWAHYRPGQENDKMPTLTYRIVAEQAKIALAEKQGMHQALIAPHRDVLAWLEGQDKHRHAEPAREGGVSSPSVSAEKDVTK